ncbi:hypothetical protein HELRODRAFT_65431, partial [Helobdella robusta]|uniref:N-acetyltransferase domain-containing protein n=1 Tax=Helobdella robusta TaxID=6412 RepID=T1FY77_HELRO
RILKPYIRRDYDSKPLRLRLLEEIINHHHQKQQLLSLSSSSSSSSSLPTTTSSSSSSSPIDFCYVRPQHIPSINGYCNEFFWPGIDLSESLDYPDYSCVALYKKLVIGFAFMVPDVSYDEAYISYIFTHPEWRKVGVAKFMLYHLLQQACADKDVTLHVSASNPALILYQMFGFKEEEFIMDFYDRYLPLESKDCRNAFFLRLKR